jgi:transcriptional regulator of acetoin/glycerol metabolism
MCCRTSWTDKPLKPPQLIPEMIRNAAPDRIANLTPSGQITANVVPLEIRMPGSAAVSSLQEVRKSAERERILQTLEAANWNVSRAARILGIERTNLDKRIRSLGLRK